eukprot:1829869-Amphidinium_carterae.1
MKSILNLGVVVPLLFEGWPCIRPRPLTQVTHQLLWGWCPASSYSRFSKALGITARLFTTGFCASSMPSSKPPAPAG